MGVPGKSGVPKEDREGGEADDGERGVSEVGEREGRTGPRNNGYVARVKQLLLWRPPQHMIRMPGYR